MVEKLLIRILNKFFTFLSKTDIFKQFIENLSLINNDLKQLKKSNYLLEKEFSELRDYINNYMLYNDIRNINFSPSPNFYTKIEENYIILNKIEKKKVKKEIYQKISNDYDLLKIVDYLKTIVLKIKSQKYNKLITKKIKISKLITKLKKIPNFSRGLLESLYLVIIPLVFDALFNEINKKLNESNKKIDEILKMLKYKNQSELESIYIFYTTFDKYNYNNKLSHSALVSNVINNQIKLLGFIQYFGKQIDYIFNKYLLQKDMDKLKNKHLEQFKKDIENLKYYQEQRIFSVRLYLSGIATIIQLSNPVNIYYDKIKSDLETIKEIVDLKKLSTAESNTKKHNIKQNNIYVISSVSLIKELINMWLKNTNTQKELDKLINEFDIMFKKHNKEVKDEINKFIKTIDIYLSSNINLYYDENGTFYIKKIYKKDK